jgi:hypothetical protein
MSTLQALNGSASSASGMAVCYNIAFLNNVTGVFQADLRLYRVAPATTEWANVKDADVNIDLSYSGASVSMASENGPAPSSKRSLEGRAVSDLTPTLVQGFNFVGKMNDDLINTPLNISKLRSYLSPEVILTTPNPADPSSDMLKTTLSPDDASFVNGLLGQGSSPSCSALACLPSPAEARRAATGEFQLPGKTFGIFPLGLIITGAWAVVACVVVGWGTLGRYRFRTQYRRRCHRGVMARCRPGKAM